MRTSPRLLPVLLAGALPLLNGCALLGLNRHEPHIEAMSTLPGDAEAFIQFEAGRVSLSSGNYAAAIAEFSYARAEPALLAPALNGMAVAYAHLGREDLAERYFREAIAAQPGDERFAANLLRLQQARLLGDTRAAAAALASNNLPLPNVVGADSGLAGAGSGTLSSRVRVAVPQQRLARIDSARVELTTFASEPADSGAQVRLRIDRPDTGTSARTGSYPVRVALRP